MSQQSVPTTKRRTGWGALKTTIGTIVAVILFVSAISIWFKGDTIFGDQSDVRYEVIGPIRTKNGFTQGIWLINRGKKVAQNVQVIATYSKSEIIDDPLYDQDKFISQPVITKTMQNRRMILELNRISPQEQGFIYLSLIGNGEKPTVSVRFDDKDGIEGVYRRSTLDSWIILISGIVNFIFLSFIISYFYKRKL